MGVVFGGPAAVVVAAVVAMATVAAAVVVVVGWVVVRTTLVVVGGGGSVVVVAFVVVNGGTVTGGLKPRQLYWTGEGGREEAPQNQRGGSRRMGTVACCFVQLTPLNKSSCFRTKCSQFGY